MDGYQSPRSVSIHLSFKGFVVVVCCLFVFNFRALPSLQKIETVALYFFLLEEIVGWKGS